MNAGQDQTVFVSYARADVDTAKAIAERLGDFDHGCFIDDQLRAGQDWWEVILANIRACPVLLSLVSPSSIRSRACKAELTYAHALGKRIVPLKIREFRMENAPEILQSINVRDFVNPDDRSYSQLDTILDDAEAALPAPLPDPLPDPPEAPRSEFPEARELLDREALSLLEQQQLVAEFRGRVQDEDDRPTVVALLEQLANHPNLMEAVAGDVTELLARYRFAPQDPQSMRLMKSVVRSLVNEQCTPILGWGLSDWLVGSRKELAQRWAHEYSYPLGLGRRDDLPQVAQYISVTESEPIMREDLARFYRQQLKDKFPDTVDGPVEGPRAFGLDQGMIDVWKEASGLMPAEPHQVLATLPCRIYVNTEPTTLLTEALRAQPWQSPDGEIRNRRPREDFCRWNLQASEDVAESPFHADPTYVPSIEEPLVFHIFGMLRYPESIVITEDDFFDFLGVVAESPELIPIDLRGGRRGVQPAFPRFRAAGLGRPGPVADADQPGDRREPRPELQARRRRHRHHRRRRVGRRARRTTCVSTSGSSGIRRSAFSGRRSRPSARGSTAPGTTRRTRARNEPLRAGSLGAPEPGQRAARTGRRARTRTWGHARSGSARRSTAGRGEIADIRGLLMAHRIVLLYSPSGAGKTSLIEAGLRPEMEQRGFTVLPTIRVGHELTTGDDRGGHNRYCSSVIASLEERLAPDDQLTPDQVAGADLEKYLPQLADGEPDRNWCLFFDQFEELFTMNLADVEAKEAFLKQLGAALKDRRFWVLIVMREDFIAYLDPHVELLPTRLKTRYRLDLLSPEAAKEAARAPAEATGVDFEEAAVDRLIDDLRQIRVQHLDRTTVEFGPHVEPLQLQIVCRRLWTPTTTAIRVVDLDKLGGVDEALTLYYHDALDRTVKRTSVRERTLRSWFERDLITTDGFRRPVREGPGKSRGGAVLSELEEAYLIRKDRRNGTDWYELTHDRIVEPIRDSNEVYRHERRRRRWIGTIAAAITVVSGVAVIVELRQRRGAAAQRDRGRHPVATRGASWNPVGSPAS